MKKHLKLLFLFLAIFFLQSCVSNYRPSFFDGDTKRYSDFKRNYSIIILDGYHLISSDLKEKLRKSFFPTAPKDTTIFFNKANEAALAIFVVGNVQIKSHDRKKQLINAMEENFYKGVEKCKECSDFKVLENTGELIVEFNIDSELQDSKTIMKMVPFPLSQNSSSHGVFALIGASKIAKFEEFKKDFINMEKSVHLTAFNESERKLE